MLILYILRMVHTRISIICSNKSEKHIYYLFKGENTTIGFS